MRISVAMSTLDAEPFLEPLLESLASQTAPPAELVVHDDASTDGTVAAIEAFAARAPFPVRVDRAPERRGFVAGFLRAAELCTGDAIAFCDQDDVWLRRKLEVCGGALRRSGAVLAMHRVRVVDAQLREIARPWPPLGPTRVVPPLGFTGLHTDTPGMTMVFRRSLVDLAPWDRRPLSRFSDDPMLHDEWILFLAGVAGAIQLLAEPLVLYRQHGANQFGWRERDRLTTLTPVMEHYREIAVRTADYARFLECLEVEDPRLSARVEAAVRHYRGVSERWALRMALYGPSGRRARVALLRRLAAARAYGRRTRGGFGWRALVKDVVGGVGLRVR